MRKFAKKCAAVMLAVLLLGGAVMERVPVGAEDAVQSYDMFLNDPEIASGKYTSNLDKYHYIYSLGLSGPGLTAWDYATGKGIKAAVIDSGANTDHRELAANIKGGYNAVTEQEGIAYVADDDGHGSICAGILGGVGNNGFGASGVAPEIDLYIVRVIDNDGLAWTANTARGIRWAVDQGCRVISISLSGSSWTDHYEEAVRYAVEHDVVIVCSGGNTGTTAKRYPAAYEGTIGVSALNYDSKTGYSINQTCTHNSDIDVAAPGSNLYGASCTSDTELAAGGLTSAAAPYVAGVAALVLSADPSLSAEECTKIIKETATDAGAPGYDEWYGHGIINPLAAVQRAKLKKTSISRSISGVAASYSKKLSAKSFRLQPRTEGSGTFSYSSDNPSVAAVDQSGNVKLKKAGTARITISISQSGIYRPASLTTKLTVTEEGTGSEKSTAAKKKSEKEALKKVKGVTVQAGRRSLTVRWKRSAGADGYQVWIARNKKFTKGKKTALIKKNKKIKKVFRKLKKNRKYFVKIRTFVKKGGKRTYGKFSKVRSVKVR